MLLQILLLAGWIWEREWSNIHVGWNLWIKFYWAWSDVRIAPIWDWNVKQTTRFICIYKRKSRMVFIPGYFNINPQLLERSLMLILCRLVIPVQLVPLCSTSWKSYLKHFYQCWSNCKDSMYLWYGIDWPWHYIKPTEKAVIFGNLLPSCAIAV